MTTPPLDLPALQAELKATRRVAKQHMNRAETAESACKTLAEVLAKHSEWIIEATDSQSVISEDGDGDWDVVWDRVMELGNKAREATARAEAAERDLAAVTVSRDGWQTRAIAAEKAVARVEALCQDTDGNWLIPEDECNNVGSILQAVRGEHTKQLGGTPTGEFADVCSCGKSYWPCDSLDGGA